VTPNRRLLSQNFIRLEGFCQAGFQRPGDNVPVGLFVGLWKGEVMFLRWRVALALAGLVLVLVSLAVLAYVLWPFQPISEQYRPAPTLFDPPQSSVRWEQPA
jgi:hypothetical protein